MKSLTGIQAIKKYIDSNAMLPLKVGIIFFIAATAWCIIISQTNYVRIHSFPNNDVNNFSVDLKVFSAAGKLILSKLSPYESSDQIEFFNPPNSLWLFALIGAIPDSQLHLLWSLLTLMLLSFSLYEFFKIYKLTSTVAPPAIIVFILSFLPLTIHLIWGQLSFLLCFSLIMAIFFNSRNSKITSGIFLSLLGIKPQIAIFFYLYFILNAFIQKDYKILSGIVLGLLVQLAFPIFYLNVNALDYFSLLKQIFNQRSLVLQSTLGHFINYITASTIWTKIMPIAGLALVLYLSKEKFCLKTVFALAITALFFAPYAWSGDYVILLPFILAVYIELTSKIKFKVIVTFSALVLMFFLVLLKTLGMLLAMFLYCFFYALFFFYYFSSLHNLESSKC